MTRLIKIFIVLFLPLTVLSAQKLEDFVNSYKKAVELKHNGNLKEALSRFNKILKSARKFGFEPEIRIHMAECKFRLGRMSNAIAELEKVKKITEKEDKYKYLKDYVNFQIGLLYYIIGREYRGAEVLSSTESRLGGEAVKEYLRFVSMKAGRLGINRGDSLDVEKIRAKLEVTIEKLKKYNPEVLKLFLARSYTFYPPRKITQINDVLTDINLELYNPNFQSIVDYTRGEMWLAHSQYTTARMKFQDFLNRYKGNRLSNFVKYYLAYIDYILATENADSTLMAKAQQEFSDVSNPNKSGTMLASHAKYFMGECARRRGELKQAERAFEDIRNSFPNSQFDFLSTFRIYQIRRDMERDTSRIARELERLQNIIPEMISGGERISRKGVYLTALSFYERGNYEQAYDLLDSTFIQNEPVKSDVVYEAGLTISVLSALKILKEKNPKVYINLPTVFFLNHINKEIPKNGEIWRGRLIYSLGDYAYIRNDKEQAERLYKMLIDDTVYSYTTIHFLARASYAWLKMERNEYDIALEEFSNAFSKSSNASTVVLAAYGLGLVNYLKGDHLKALQYFRVKRVKETEQVPALYELLEERRGIKVEDNELAKEILDDNLWYLGQSYEALQSYLDAIDVYKYLVDHFPQSERAADASQRVVDIYTMAALTAYNSGDPSSASTYIQSAKSYFDNYVVRYRDMLGENWPGYCRSLSVLQQAYMAMQQQQLAEQLARRISAECGVSDVLEVYYYQQALSAFSPAEVEDKIEKVKSINRYSKYLPDMYWYLLKLYLNEEHRDYRKIINICEELRAWPDQTLVADMPTVLYYLAIAYAQIERNDEAIRTFKQLVEEYPDFKNTPQALFTLGTLLFAKAEKLRKAGRSIDALINYYRDVEKYMKRLKNEYADNPYVQRQMDIIDSYINEAVRRRQ